MSVRVLIVGRSGYLGSRFAEFFDSIGIEHFAFTRGGIAKYSFGYLEREIYELRPDLVINCAGAVGHPTVDALENFRMEAMAGNVVLPAMLSLICSKLSIRWVHVSSGCIYNGTSPRPGGFREDDPATVLDRSVPASVYAHSKAIGEIAIARDPNCYTLRLRVPFDHRNHPRNYLSKLIQYETLLDVTQSLTSLDDFIESAWTLYQRNAPTGTYNVVNPGAISTQAITEMLARAGLRSEFKFFSSQAEFEGTVTAPRSVCVLDSTKLSETGIVLPPVACAVESAIKHWSNS